jgi:hypothetical protein
MKHVAFLALTLIATPAFAGDEPALTGKEFIMPSRNVACLVQDVSLEGGSGLSKRLYCLRNEPTTLAVMLDERGLESWPTDGDTQFNWEAPMLAYGESWWHDGFSCESLTSGVVCRHEDYGSFKLSRKGVKKLQ